MLVVIDGAKALRKAIRTVFGDLPVQRSVRHYADLRVMPTWGWEPLRVAGLALARSA